MDPQGTCWPLGQQALNQKCLHQLVPGIDVSPEPKAPPLRLFLIAAFCRLAKLLNYSKQRVGAMGIEPDRPLNLQ